ncbi:TPA: hypothetical protein I7678_18020 [Vibrio vulnificus]|nr:hypothetical protein [Vibrio vulnificus]
MKFKKALLASLLVTLTSSPLVYSAELWDESKVYNSGDIVRWNDKVFISSHWTKGTEPVDNQLSWDGWITLDSENIPSWAQESVYKGGDVVEFNAGYYIAKWWNTSSLPSNSDSWQRVDLKSIVVDTTKPEPEPEPETPIIGLDKDGDGLRDDYAEKIAQTYADPVELAIAVQSGKEFGKLLEFSENNVEISVEDAKFMAINAIGIQYCIDNYQYENPNYVNPIDLYFDTLERAVAKVSASSRLYKALQGNEPDITEIDCIAFFKGVSK